MKIIRLQCDADLNMVQILNATSEYRDEFSEYPMTLLHATDIDYVPALLYGTDPACITIRERIKVSMPVPHMPYNSWMLVGDKGIIYSPGS